MISKKDNVTIIEMGHGTIDLMMQIKDNKATVSFGQFEEPLEIGSKVEKDSQTERQVAIEFKDPQALDRFINDLVKLQETGTRNKMFHKPSYNLGLRDAIGKVTELFKES